MPLTIRRATNADSEDVVRVIRAVFDEYGFSWESDGYHADLYDIEGYYDRIGDAFFVAELDGVVVGTAAVEYFPPIPGEVGSVVLQDGYVRVCGADCSMERVYVSPSARRGGIGSELIRRMMSEAASQGRRVMELWSDKKFGDAHRLYGKFGAQVVGERLCDDPEQSPEWGLALPLLGLAEGG